MLQTRRPKEIGGYDSMSREARGLSKGGQGQNNRNLVVSHIYPMF